MLQEGKGPINFTVFLTLFGEKLNGEPGAGLGTPTWAPPDPCPPRRRWSHSCILGSRATSSPNSLLVLCLQSLLPNPKSQCLGQACPL